MEVLKIRIRIRWIRKILASWIQGVKYQPKNCKKNFLLLKLKSELLKKEIIKNSSFLNGLSSFRIKIREIKQKFETYLLLK